MLYRLHIRTTFQRREYLNLPNCFRQGITILKRFKNQCPTKTSAIPASPLIELGPTTEDDPGGKWPCREAVGSLPWLAIMARPNMANAVRVVARHSHNPGEERWNAVLKILSYLRGTKGRGPTFTRSHGLGVSVYVEADYAKKANDRRSVSEAAVMCGSVCVCWSTTQRCVTSSTPEGECVACGNGIKGALFACAVLDFLQPHLRGKPIVVFEDNEGAKALAEHPLTSTRSKQIDVRLSLCQGFGKVW